VTRIVLGLLLVAVAFMVFGASRSFAQDRASARPDVGRASVKNAGPARNDAGVNAEL
jgi:hypothetical protein